MFSINVGIFIPKGWGIQEERFVSDLQQWLLTDINTNHTEALLQTKYFGIYSENIIRRSVYSLV